MKRHAVIARSSAVACGHCVSVVATAVKDVDAKASVDVDLAQHRALIEPVNADGAERESAIREAGLHARSSSATHATEPADHGPVALFDPAPCVRASERQANGVISTADKE